MPANPTDSSPPIAAILLDLDGTLLDTAPDLADSVNALRAERDLAPLPEAKLRPLASWGARGMLRGGLDIGPEDPDYRATRERFIEFYRDRLTARTAPFPGMREVLARIAAEGRTWGVVTNKFESLAVPLMRRMDFQPPPVCVVGGDSAAHPKPHPAPLLLACNIAGLDPAACVYVGDAARDVAAGRAAGMRTVAAAYGYIEPDENIKDWGADCVIHSAGELATAIATLEGRDAAVG